MSCEPRNRLRSLGALALCVFFLGCISGGDSSNPTDGGLDDAAPDGDSPPTRAGSGGDGAPVEGFGAACTRGPDCGSGLACDAEIDVSFEVEGLPNNQSDIPSSLFPGGSCTPIPAAGYDPTGARSCDPLGVGIEQGCGDEGACVILSLSGQSLVACRPRCEPVADDSGCQRFGYTCDFDSKACLEGCQSDEECRLRLADADGDGEADFVEYDADSDAICDLATFRCSHETRATADTGEGCERPDDCDPDGACVAEPQTFAGHDFPDGYCTKLGCDIDGRECSGDNAVCERLRGWSAGVVTAAACLTRCEVGAEPEADQVGPTGHGEGCRSGYRCHYNGGPGREGVCVGGEYNDVTENNIGAACERNSECYSPFGQGECLFLSLGESITAPSGTCSVLDCAAPGIPTDVCGEQGACLGLNGDVTFCVQTCAEAEDCAPGFACSDDDLDPSTDKICYPACFGAEDCRKDVEVCAIDAAVGAGTCVASDG